VLRLPRNSTDQLLTSQLAAYSSSYAILWNAFKRLAAGSSDDEKAKLFSGTAKRVYRLA
jgi:predicted TIM-barrel fold metal-dependent hydrolase